MPGRIINWDRAVSAYQANLFVTYKAGTTWASSSLDDPGFPALEERGALSEKKA